MDEIRQRCLSLVPDMPLWVETRDLLLWEDSELIENVNQKGFVVWSPEDELGSVVGKPEPNALTQAAKDVSELLAFADNIDFVQSLLTDFDSELATIFSEPVQLPSAPSHTCREINMSEIAAHDHLPDDLLSELTDASEDDAIIVAAFDGELPVAFAYGVRDRIAMGCFHRYHTEPPSAGLRDRRRNPSYDKDESGWKICSMGINGEQSCFF